MHKEDDQDIVYSTDLGDMRKSGSKSRSSSRSKSSHSGGSRAHSLAPADGGDGAKVRREKKGRGGKTVTAVYNTPLPEDKLKELGTKLKKSCGSGGSVKNGVIEIQGDKVDTVLEILEKEGIRAKRAGG